MTGLFKSNPRRHLRKLIKQKKYDEALKYGHDIEKNLEHDPDVAFIIGTVYFMKGDVSLEVVSTDYDGMMEEGKKLREYGNPVSYTHLTLPTTPYV